MKRVQGIYSAPGRHWVGNGFPVRSLFDYQGRADSRSPFLLLDYAGPARFPAAERPRGVGQHPHRGFETVTVVYAGEVAHRDSTGEGGIIGPGDVQWMTAGHGIIHEEFHSPAFTASGGDLEMVQLWVNLPAKDKLTPAGYQGLLNADIPRLALAEGKAQLRIIAGDYGDERGPARTFTPINLWDLSLEAGADLNLALPAGHTSMIALLKGTVQVNGDLAREVSLIELSRDGDAVRLQANNDATLLVMTGEPLGEPVVGHGPFVMNSVEEIDQAIRDYQHGAFGRID